MVMLLLPHLRSTGGVVYSGSSFTLPFGMVYDMVRCEQGVYRDGPEEEEFDEDEYDLLCCQRVVA
jgi:hypothetical protein